MSLILPKSELENVKFCPSLLGQKLFVRFLGELKTLKFPFKINWPLAEALTHVKNNSHFWEKENLKEHNIFYYILQSNLSLSMFNLDQVYQEHSQKNPFIFEGKKTWMYFFLIYGVSFNFNL